MRPHAAAPRFAFAARQAVAAGALFEVRDGSFRVRGTDHRDILGALLAAAGFECGPVIGGGKAARLLGLDPRGSAAQALCDLGDLGDRGEYAGERGRANLARDLLGVEVIDG